MRFGNIGVQSRRIAYMDNMIGPYDRKRGELIGCATFTKPSTIKHCEDAGAGVLTNAVQTFIVDTARLVNDGGKVLDYIFIEHVSEAGIVTRLALPPKVANAIVSQRDSLTSRRRKAAAKARAKADKAAGIKRGFLKKEAA
jgi:hypothetical protein